MQSDLDFFLENKNNMIRAALRTPYDKDVCPHLHNVIQNVCVCVCDVE